MLLVIFHTEPAGEGGGPGAHDGAEKHCQSAVQQAGHGYCAGDDDGGGFCAGRSRKLGVGTISLFVFPP